jgi:hypothetical protein
MESSMIDLSQIVSSLGEQTIVEMGEPLGLSKEQSIKAARALAENFTGNKDQAIEAAAKETGIGKEVLNAMIVKLLDTAKDQAVDAMKDQATQAAKGMFGKFFGR